MFESIHAPTHYLSESFVGLVLMPCVLASLESATDALRSRQGMVWVAEGAFGATIRVSLCVLPVAVLLGWAVGKEMDMVLDGFQVAILTLSVLMVNHVINSISVHCGGSRPDNDIPAKVAASNLYGWR
ncbi:Vacuolar calcium ion transporter [Beauveria bassiana]|uniref:Vacuolar calcium ion transporter n=1 Tax=Beauveria bassiana TaxID=176275 RepID=A0A2N6NJT2_BEABA|nr:Vacuolar calcium ion transporter [Beauveria bassiana]